MSKPSIIILASNTGTDQEENDETLIVIGAIISDEFLNRVAKVGILKYLTTKYSKFLVGACLDYHRRFGRAPKSSITEVVEDKIQKLEPTTAKLTKRLLEYVAERYGDGGDEFDFDYILHRTEQYIQKQSLILRRLQEEPLLEENRISEALELLSGYKSPSLSEDIGKAQLSEVLPRLTISFQDLEEMDLKKRGFLLLGNFPLERNTVTLISGDPGAGKTWLVYELAKIASTGERGFGGHCYASDRTKTLIVDGELPLKDIEERSKVMELGGIRHLSLLSKSLLEKHDIVPGLNLTDREVRQLLSDYLEENGIELLVLDNLFSLFGGIDLNSAEAWSPVNDWLLKLRSKGVSTILVHHPNKQGTQLGTHSKLFNINNALTLRREIPNDGDADCCCFSIKVDKQRGRGIKLSGKKFIFKDGEWSHEIKFRGKTEKDS